MLSRLLVALATTLLMMSAPASAAPADDLNNVLETSMLGSKVPAMGLLLIHDGKIEEQAQRGLRRSDASGPVQSSDVWHIGSDGKAMTATLIARLVDRGVLRWTTPLQQMLPGLADEMRPEYRKITLVELLSHRAGLPHDVVETAEIGRVGAEHRSSRQQRLDYIAIALKDPPVNTPGTAYSYSNTGYLIAAVVAERATGEPYEALMQEQIFAPLGMTSVGFGFPPDGEPSGHFDGQPATSGNPEFIAPAGNIYLSLRDWATFCIDQMDGANGRGKLLKPETYRLMQTQQPDSNYGFGWQVLPTAMGAQGPVLAHRGSDGTWWAQAVLFPKTRSGAIAVANAGQSMGGDKVDEAAIRAVIGRLAPPAGP